MVKIDELKMNSDKPKEYSDVVEGAVDDYVNDVQLISENEAVSPGSTKIKNISIKPIMVNKNIRFNSLFQVLDGCLTSLPQHGTLQINWV